MFEPTKTPGARFRTVVVDDEPTAREAILTFLAEEPSVEVVGEAGNGSQAVEVIQRLRPDLLFLDIQMPDLDGFGVLDALGEDVPRGVVFVTAHDEHALRAFEVHALDYLLKPFGRPRFKAAVRRALDRLEADEALSVTRTFRSMTEGLRVGSTTASDLLRSGPGGTEPSGPTHRPTRLGVRQGPRTVLVELDDIDWMQADGDYVRIHVRDKIHLVSERMQELETLLNSSHFLRIHRSVIVHLPRIRELRRDPDGGGTALLENGVQLRVARTRWEGLERALGLGGYG